jgi:predicted HicB family RNase H-like nuclease
METAHKDATLIIRASESQIKAWKEAAARKGRSLSEWVRENLMSAYKRGE